MCRSSTSIVSYRAHSLVALTLLTVSAASTILAGEGYRSVSASAYGIVLMPNQDRLVVARVTGPFASFGLRTGDQIVAVDGRRVTTERAFVARLVAGNRSASGADILVGRNGQAIHVNSRQYIAAGGGVTSTSSSSATDVARSAPPTATSRSGFINPANMVITKDGRVMHKDVAARLGLESRPFEGSVATPPAVN